MKYIKTFEQHASISGPDVNEGVLGGIAKVFNKLGSNNIDLNTDDAKVAEIAKKVESGLSYAAGKIATAAKTRWDVIKAWRKIFTDGGIPANLVDKAIVLYAANNTFANVPTFNQEFEGGGSILTFDPKKNSINIRSASTKVANPNPGGE